MPTTNDELEMLALEQMAKDGASTEELITNLEALIYRGDAEPNGEELAYLHRAFQLAEMKYHRTHGKKARREMRDIWHKIFCLYHPECNVIALGFIEELIEGRRKDNNSQPLVRPRPLRS